MKLMSFLALPLILIASVAQARPSAYNMTCGQATNLVAQNPGVVMNYAYHPQAGHLYEKFYPYSTYCGRVNNHTEGKAARVKTTDSNSCLVGYVCVPTSRD